MVGVNLNEDGSITEQKDEVTVTAKSDGSKGSDNNESGHSQGSNWPSALSFGLTIGEATRQVKVYETFGRSAETVEKALSQKKFVHANGKTYSQRFRGNQYIKSNSLKNSLKTGKFAKNLGKGMTALGVGVAIYQYSASDQSGADDARLAGALLITGSAFIPVVGPLVSIGLGVADSFGAFDGIYNSFEP